MSDLASIHAVCDRYLAAYTAQDAERVAAIFAVDGQLYAPFSAPAFGRPAIAATHVEWFKDGERDKTMTVIDAASSGALGQALIGFAATIDDENGQPERLYGMSLNTFVNTADGWQIRQCCLNLFDTPPDGFPR
jgi:uncharacterized protein (TIGR02246 family)